MQILPGQEPENPPEGVEGEGDPTKEHLSFVNKIVGDKDDDAPAGGAEPVADVEGAPPTG